MKTSRGAKAKKRISFEKKVALQALAAVVVLIYGVVVAKTNASPGQKEFIHKAVNITYSKGDIAAFAHSAADLSKRAIATCGKYFDTLVYFCNNGFGNQPDTGSAMAREQAEPAVYPQQPLAEQPAEEQPQQQPQPDEPEAQFRYPAVGEITSYFGERTHPIGGNESVHYGVDIAANHGDCVISSLPGTVSDTGFDPNLGNYVKVRHSDSMETVYGHMSEVLVRKDEVVDGNTRIGSVGATGAATGPHVHLEVRVDGVCRDPMEFLP